VNAGQSTSSSALEPGNPGVNIDVFGSAEGGCIVDKEQIGMFRASKGKPEICQHEATSSKQKGLLVSAADCCISDERGANFEAVAGSAEARIVWQKEYALAFIGTSDKTKEHDAPFYKEGCNEYSLFDVDIGGHARMICTRLLMFEK
jgi:hypothetical protein